MTKSKTQSHLSKGKLRRLVTEATVDCYNVAEQVSGFLTMIEDRVSLPFKTKVLGVKVTVERFEQTRHDEIVAICNREGIEQAVFLLGLPLPRPRPVGVEWIEAYRLWSIH